MRSAIRSKETPDLSKYEIFDLEINASPAIVWSLLTTYEEVPKVFGFITRIKRLRQTGPILLLEQEVHPLPPVPAIKYTVEVTEDKEVKLSWDGRTPYIKVNKGFFQLESLEGGTKTHVTFACWAEAALLVPVFVVRLQQKIIMPKVLQILKEHAEKK